MPLRVMSADSHMDLVFLPPDAFTARMDRAWGDAIPHVVERDGRRVWGSGGGRAWGRGGGAWGWGGGGSGWGGGGRARGAGGAPPAAPAPPPPPPHIPPPRP